MIPVRARVDSPITTSGRTHTLKHDHPLAAADCPACDAALMDRPITLVIVGVDPKQRAEGKAYAACGAVVVHADCAGLTPEPEAPEPM